jgi:hypothetical protein
MVDDRDSEHRQPPPSAEPPSAEPPPAAQPPPRADVPPPEVVYVQQTPVPTNGLATAALVLGIIGAVLFWTVWAGILLGILATIFGAVGLSRTNRGAPNKGMAVAGLVLGVLAIIASVVFTVAIVNVVDSDDTIREIEACLENPDAC